MPRFTALLLAAACASAVGVKLPARSDQTVAQPETPPPAPAPGSTDPGEGVGQHAAITVTLGYCDPCLRAGRSSAARLRPNDPATGLRAPLSEMCDGRD